MFRYAVINMAVDFNNQNKMRNLTTPALKSELSKMRRKKIYCGLHDLYVEIRSNGRIHKNFFLIALDESECCRHFP